MKNKHTPLKRVAAQTVSHFGTQAALAKALGYEDRRNVTNWVNGVHPFPPGHCVAIERLTEGKITRKQLRPTDYAELWPELAEAK